MRPKKTSTAALVLLLAASLFAPAASAHSAPLRASTGQAAALVARMAPPLPPAGAARYAGLKVRCTNYGSYMQVSGTVTSYVYKVPKKRKYRDLLTVSYYQEIKVAIVTPAGYNGTLWKTLAKTKHTQKQNRISAKGYARNLPSTVWATAAYNTRYGMGDYAVELQVRLKRDIPGPDSTVWLYKVRSATKSCVTVR